MLQNHVKPKQNGGCAKYCAFVLENTVGRKPRNHGKSREACQEMTLPIPLPQKLVSYLFLLLLARQLFQCAPSYVDFE